MSVIAIHRHCLNENFILENGTRWKLSQVQGIKIRENSHFRAFNGRIQRFPV